MPNQINYSTFFDFSSPEQIDKAIATLSKLNTQLEKLFKTVSQDAESSKVKIIQVGQAVATLSETTEAGRKALQDYATQQEKNEKQYKEQKEAIKQYEIALKKLQKEIDALKNTRKKEVTQLNEVEKAEKRLTKTQSEEGKQLARLNLQIQNQRKANKDLAKETLGLNDAYAKLISKTNQAQLNFKRLSAEFGINSKQAKEARKQYEISANKLGEINKQARDGRPNVGNYSSGFNGLKGNLLGAVTAITGVTLGIQLLGTVFKEAFSNNREFELAIAKVGVTSGATAEQVKSLEALAKNLGATTQFSASQVAELQLNLSRLGFTVPEIENVTESILNLATATDEDLGQTAEVVGNVIRSLGLTASDAGRVTDVLAKSFSSSALNLERFQEAFKLVGPIARVANISLEDTTALLGKLADVGLTGSIGGTALKNVLSDLTDPASKLAKNLGFTVNNGEGLIKAFKQLRKQGIDLGEATQLVDERAKAAFLTFIDGIDSVESLSTALQNSAGTAQNAADVIGNTLDGDVKKLASTFEALTLQGGFLDGVFRGIIKSLTSLLSGLNGLVGVSADLKDEYVDLLSPQKEFVFNLENERFKTEALLKELKRVIEAGEDRTDILRQLNEEYPDALKNLNAETAGYDDLAEAINEANKQILTNLLLEKERDQIQQSAARNLKAVQTLNKQQSELIRERTKVFTEQARAVSEAQDRFNKAIEANAPLNVLESLDPSKTSAEFSKALDDIDLQIALTKALLEDAVSFDFTSRTIEAFDNLAAQFGITLKRIKEEGNNALGDSTTKISGVSGGKKSKSELEKELIDFSNREKEIREKLNADLLALDKDLARQREELIQSTLLIEEAARSGNKEILNKAIADREEVEKRIEKLKSDRVSKTRDFEITANDDIIKEIENLDSIEKRLIEERSRLNAEKDAERIAEIDFNIEFIKSKEEELFELQKQNEETLRDIQEDNFEERLKQSDEELAKAKEVARIKESVDRDLNQRNLDNQKKLQQAALEGAFKNAENQRAAQLALVGIETYLASLEYYKAKQQELSAINQTLPQSPQFLASRDAAIAISSNVLANGFYDGGYVGDGGKYEEKGVVHGGEFVLTKDLTSSLGLNKDGLSQSKALDIITNRLLGDAVYENNKQIKDYSIINNTRIIESKIDYVKLGETVANAIPKSRFEEDVAGHLRVIKDQDIGRNRKRTITILKSKYNFL